MKIKEVSKLTGLPISTLRFYERKNLIPDSYVKRDANNYRVYSEDIVEFLDDVKALLSVDFSIEELSLLVDQQLNLSYEAKTAMIEQKSKKLKRSKSD